MRSETAHVGERAANKRQNQKVCTLSPVKDLGGQNPDIKIPPQECAIRHSLFQYEHPGHTIT